ncbi:hypothetical protein B0H17DRAFT_1204586 [Mycena rosella]|uniref:Uncharacterized protein n=1 Tax=Mycena rosella TaxID=1033263 RepID=A0AAD7D903_MYCRO|nr:hypothetical protein B0H17DRAFT_1204586 [Mycena rosella]
MSGAAVFNDLMQQLIVDKLPFGGVGESGHGVRVSKYTYDFINHSFSIDVPKEVEPFNSLPDVSEEEFKAMTVAAFLPIPDTV